MQELGALSASTKAAILDSMDTTKPYVLKDTRDDKYYNVAKLADGRVWMTTNLNLTGGTALYSDDSDVAAANTRASGTPYYTLPASNKSGFSDDAVAYVYNTGKENHPAHDSTAAATCIPSNSSTGDCDSYYSWFAATVGGKDSNGNVVTGDGLDTAYSICPNGWRLPKSGKDDDTSPSSTVGYKKGDFYKLATAYGADLESDYYEDPSTFYNNAGLGTLPNFLLAGEYYGGSFYYNQYGSYWSSSSGPSSSSSTRAYTLLFDSQRVYSANRQTRRHGYPVRCVLSES